MSKVLVLHSGGMDSTVCLAKAIKDGHEVRCMGIHYGQRHAKELEAATRIQDYYKIIPERRGVVDLQIIRPLLKGSSQTDPKVAVPEGHYEEESMKKTVVPNRNMIMLSVAVAGAISAGYEQVWYAAHAGDHAIYPDCRPEFVEAMQRAIGLCDWTPISLGAPFIQMTKSQIAKLGAELDAPLHMTWSCYKGGAHHCGVCGTCVERKEAFKLAKVPDPTIYTG